MLNSPSPISITEYLFNFNYVLIPPKCVKAHENVREKENLLKLFACHFTYIRLQSIICYVIGLNDNVKFLFHKFWILI